MTADTETLSYLQIIRHHNETQDGFAAGEATIAVKPAPDITF